MKKAFLGTLAAAVMLITPAVSFAALYQYVNTSGNIETISADSAAQALAMPNDLAPHSGVMLVQTDPSPGAAGIYTGMRSSADTSGIAMGLVLESDGTAALASNYENGQTPIVENGSWTLTSTGQVQLTLSGTPTLSYNPSHVIVFNEINDGLVAAQYDQSLYGSAGLTFTKQN